MDIVQIIGENKKNSEIEEGLILLGKLPLFENSENFEVNYLLDLINLLFLMLSKICKYKILYSTLIISQFTVNSKLVIILQY